MPDSELYSGRGDDGYTGLLGPERVPKYDPRPEAYGAVDEAQAALGVARTAGCTPRTAQVLAAVQRDLYDLMAELAAAGDEDSAFAGSVTPEYVDQLERWIAEFEGEIEMPKEFVLPGDGPADAALHLARTVTRRAERRAVRLLDNGLLKSEEVVRYLNRLSSLLYGLALLEASAATERGPTLVKPTRVSSRDLHHEGTETRRKRKRHGRE